MFIPNSPQSELWDRSVVVFGGLVGTDLIRKRLQVGAKLLDRLVRRDILQEVGRRLTNLGALVMLAHHLDKAVERTRLLNRLASLLGDGNGGKQVDSFLHKLWSEVRRGGGGVRVAR